MRKVDIKSPMIERLEAVKKCDRISGGAVRPLHIWLSQLKLLYFEEFAENDK
jgi:hypothetical protein